MSSVDRLIALGFATSFEEPGVGIVKSMDWVRE